MRRITLAVMSTVSALVLLFSYHTSTGSGGGQPVAAGTATGGEPDGAAPAAGSSGTGSGTGSSDASGSQTDTGDTADTRWGPVQVAITVEDGRITRAEAVVYPTGNHRDQEINAYAIPELNAAAVAQQSGDIDAVSGATVTSDGYVESLQSAIDQAHL
jgi:uncharacterized protein with FMN-binding domain